MLIIIYTSSFLQCRTNSAAVNVFQSRNGRDAEKISGLNKEDTSIQEYYIIPQPRKLCRLKKKRD